MLQHWLLCLMRMSHPDDRLASTLGALWADHVSLPAGLLTNHCAYCVMGQSVIHGHNINLIYGPIRTLRIGRAAVYVGWPGFAGTLSAPMRQVWLVRYIRIGVTDSCPHRQSQI
jgi:hypothetical protein